MGPTIATCLSRWTLSHANPALIRKPDLWEEILATSDTFLDETDDGFIFTVRSGDDLDFAELLHEREVAPRIIALLRMSKTFIDVGANIGAYSARATRLMRKPCTILSFEPHPENCKLLHLNLLSNQRNSTQASVMEYRMALASYDGYATLMEPIKGFGGSSLSEEFLRWKGEWPPLKSFKVSCVRLDDIEYTKELTTIDLLKIDVEGAEFEVIDGGKETLRKVQNIVVESSNQPGLTKVLFQHGFRLVESFHNGFYSHFSRRS